MLWRLVITSLWHWGTCAISDEILSNCALLTAVGEKKMYFIGNFLLVMSCSGIRLVEWAPDKLRAEMGDKVVMVKYVDEVKPAVLKWNEAKLVALKQRFFG